MEDRINVLEKKVDMLLRCIEEIDGSNRKEDFNGKWADRISEIEGDQKTLYGDNWNEGEGIWNFVESHKDDEGFNEEALVNGYIDSVKEKFAKLRGEAQGDPAAEAAVEAAEEKAEAGAEQAEAAVQEAEAAVAGAESDSSEPAESGEAEEAPLSDDEEPDPDEVEKALSSDLLLG